MLLRFDVESMCGLLFFKLSRWSCGCLYAITSGNLPSVFVGIYLFALRYEENCLLYNFNIKYFTVRYIYCSTNCLHNSINAPNQSTIFNLLYQVSFNVLQWNWHSVEYVTWNNKVRFVSTSSSQELFYKILLQSCWQWFFKKTLDISKLYLNNWTLPFWIKNFIGSRRFVLLCHHSCVIRTLIFEGVSLDFLVRILSVAQGW